MFVPASLAISKTCMPEMDEPVIRGHVAIDHGQDKDKATSQTTVSTLALEVERVTHRIWPAKTRPKSVPLFNACKAFTDLLIWIGKGFSIHKLAIQLVLRYVFYPLLATKLVEHEFVAYLYLETITNFDNPLSERAFAIASYALCGFANLGSLGIQVGVLSALAPSRAKVIARIAASAMICGFISTVQAAGMAGMLV
ncbi:hypothetical protein V8D89_003095 [Ganoderma adspersum]